MAASSYVHDQTAHSTLLTVKPNQLMIVDIEPYKYEPYLRPIFECLKYSPLVHALTKMEDVPITLLSKAYSSASSIKKPTLPPQWNALFTLLFKGFSERVTGSDYASKLFLTILYGIYTDLNVDFGADALTFTMSTFHTTANIVADNSKFLFIGSIPEAMFRDVHVSSKILEGYHKLTLQMQAITDEANKPKKGGKDAKKCENKIVVKEGTCVTVKPPPKRKAPMNTSTAIPKRRKQPAHKRKTPTPSESEDESDTQSDIRIEEDYPVRNEEAHNEEVHDKDVRNEDDNLHNEEQISNPEVNQHLNDFVPSPPPSPKMTTTPITIAPCPPPVSSQKQTNIPLSTPLFTDSNVPPTTITKPPVSVNISDTGAKTSGFSTHVSSPISLIFPDDPDMVFRDDDNTDESLGGFTYSPSKLGLKVRMSHLLRKSN
ncbi:unnamed protein product [Lactuca saligna]|uniref:Uncharacterized protein n=1 Tax=Lactuca saligna TaxID=75948 RepID=A0AA36E787_LACSI|nr:unnamed protein product [Lactuca saligna]